MEYRSTLQLTPSTGSFHLSVDGQHFQLVPTPGGRGRQLVPVEQPGVLQRPRHKEEPIKPLPQGFFSDKIPSEIIAAISRASNYAGDRAALIRLNKFCRDACTSALYGPVIQVTDSKRLNKLCKTLIYLRPDFAPLVKGLVLQTSDTWHATWNAV